MSEDWKPGDLAVCVDVRTHELPTYYASAGEWLRLGATYRVAAVSPVSSSGKSGLAPYLWLDGCRRTASHIRFRKITPDKHEPCEEEFQALLDRSKQPVKAR